MKQYSFFNLKRTENGGEIRVEGDIVDQNDKWIYDWFGIDAAAPREIREQLDELNGAPVTVWINSYGGSYVAGSAIYTELLNYTGEVTVIISGTAYSSASLIAMAGKRILISPSGSVGIHEVSTVAEGDWRDMEHASNFLREIRKGLIDAYQRKTGLPWDEISDMVEADTLMSARTAVRLGFADEIFNGKEDASAEDNPTRPDIMRNARAVYAERLTAWGTKKQKSREMAQPETREEIDEWELWAQAALEIEQLRL